MARYRKKAPQGTAMLIITLITTITIALFVGNSLLTSVGSTIGNISCTADLQNDTCGTGNGTDDISPFYAAFSFLGMDDTGGTWSTTGIVGVLALAAVAGVVLFLVRRSLKNR